MTQQLAELLWDSPSASAGTTRNARALRWSGSLNALCQECELLAGTETRATENYPVPGAALSATSRTSGAILGLLGWIMPRGGLTW
jgi:hypothetical protein